MLGEPVLLRVRAEGGKCPNVYLSKCQRPFSVGFCCGLAHLVHGVSLAGSFFLLSNWMSSFIIANRHTAGAKVVSVSQGLVWKVHPHTSRNLAILPGKLSRRYHPQSVELLKCH